MSVRKKKSLKYGLMFLLFMAVQKKGAYNHDFIPYTLL